jgi:Ran GTPase-activating protein (RanGAP) involved in mRNA processing and transport
MISLNSNTIGDQGAKYLADAIKINSTLQEIYLGDNSIEDEGAEYLSQAIKLNSTLQVLTLEAITLEMKELNVLLRPSRPTMHFR